MSDVSNIRPSVQLPALADYVSNPEATWPAPPPPRLRLPVSALTVAVVAMLVVPDAGLGLNVLVVALSVAVAVLLTVRRRRPGAFGIGLTTIALLLSGVAVIRDSEGLVTGCVFAAMMLAMAVAIGGKSWGVLVSTPFLFTEAVVRSVPWAGKTLKRRRPRRLPFESPGSVVGGVLFGLVCATAVGMLLASADATFARVLGHLGGWFTLDVGNTDVFTARLIMLAGVTLYVLGLGFAAATQLKTSSKTPVEGSGPGQHPAGQHPAGQHPAGQHPAGQHPAGQHPAGRHPAEWLPPLILVAATIAAFLAVDATRLFGGAQTVLREESFTHATRAREGFGQLLVVTLLVLLLLAWAGRATQEKHRRWLALSGGTLLVLALLLAFSALRRLWLYQGEYGWTVTRLNGGAFELWVVLLLVTVGVTWLLRRTDLLPRLTIGSAGLGLLVVALAGPDALVATANVQRYERTGLIDTYYLSNLSADAVPALMKLSEPARSQALPARPKSTPWYAWNLSRARADHLFSIP